MFGSFWRLINQSDAGIPVFKNSFAGRFTIQSIKSSSMSAFLIAASFVVLLVSAPLARTNPATPPFGDR